MRRNTTIKFSRELAIYVCLVCAILSGCKEEPLTEQEQVTEVLVSAEAWGDPVVTVNGVDVSDVYKDFRIQFSPGTYSTMSGAPMWAASGKWKFGDETAKHMILDDTVEVDIIELTETRLELERFWKVETFVPGRAKSVQGKNKFRMVPGGWR
jgi:hypothetical protein